MYTRTSLLFFICLMCSISNKAQQIDSSYLIYQQQFINLSTTRSISEMEARQVLKKFSSYNVSSNQDMARLLNSLYPSNQGVGVLLYLYTHDSLKRTFFEPGKIVEEATIPVTATQMFLLGDQLHTALELQKLAANRQPVERGFSIKPQKASSPVPPLDSIIQQLTNILLPPAFSNKYQHLVIIPALNIGTLPFHLLRPYGDTTYLIDKCSFTVAPTLIDFVGLRMKAAATLSGVPLSEINIMLNSPYHAGATGKDLNWEFSDGLFISNPQYPQNTKYVFPDLPGAAREVDSIIKYFKQPVVFKGREATKQEILKNMNGKEIAYFATHGISSADNPKDNSYVVLSGDDPFLTSKQIMDLRLDSTYHMPEMVVLSACQTALGKSMEAGISGSLARSFILAGSKHVITSLWSVDDDATAFMMSRFMFYLKQPHLFTPSEPLRLAIIDTKERFPKPAYWASFILLGIDY